MRRHGAARSRSLSHNVVTTFLMLLWDVVLCDSVVAVRELSCYAPCLLAIHMFCQHKYAALCTCCACRT